MKDDRRVRRRGKDTDPYWECHWNDDTAPIEPDIEPDWLLIWDDDGSTVTLIRTGTHSDLFR